MIVVSNASPIISLAKVDLLPLLPELFGEIVLAPEVRAEILAGGSRPAAASIDAFPWLKVQPITDSARLQNWRQTYRLGAGELATILLAQQLRADLAIIDEHAARLLAATVGIKVIGCVGILELGYRRQRLGDLRKTYQDLLMHGVHIDRGILNRSLAAFNLPNL